MYLPLIRPPINPDDIILNALKIRRGGRLPAYFCVAGKKWICKMLGLFLSRWCILQKEWYPAPFMGDSPHSESWPLSNVRCFLSVSQSLVHDVRLIPMPANHKLLRRRSCASSKAFWKSRWDTSFGIWLSQLLYVPWKKFNRFLKQKRLFLIPCCILDIILSFKNLTRLSLMIFSSILPAKDVSILELCSRELTSLLGNRR